MKSYRSLILAVAALLITTTWVPAQKTRVIKSSATALASRVETFDSKDGQDAKVSEAKEGVLLGDLAPEIASTNNYVFVGATNGSLTNMTSGTTTLLAANTDDTASPITNIGFDFYFQGIRYSTFAINDNGLLRLGGAAQVSTPYQPLAQAGLPIITAYGADQRTHTTGQVRFKVTGSAPNRVLTVEWFNNQANFNAGGTADLTYQVRLYETTGVIEFVYGTMTMSVAGAASTDSQDPQIGFSSNNAANTVGSIVAPQTGIPAPTYNGTSAVPGANLYTAGAITTLSNAVDGSRRIFSFTPPIPVAPSNNGVTGITSTGLTVNWNDLSSNEALFAVYRSTDNINFTFAGVASENGTSFIDSGLVPSTNYFYNVYSVTEGALSATPASFSTATGAAGNDTCNGAGGNWNTPGTWTDGSVPTAGDNVTIGSGCTVTIDIGALALNVTVQNGGILQYEAGIARALTVGANVTIDSGGTFQTAASGLITGHTLNFPAGNLINNGTLDFSTSGNNAGATIIFTGLNNSTISGTGATTDIRAITVNKGTSSTNSVELLTSNFTVQGVNTDVAGYLTLTNGTFKISGTFTMTNRTFTSATYSIGATTQFWLNNPNYTVAGQAGGTTTSNNGILRMTLGVYNIGLTGADGMGGGTGASFIVEGGTINATRIDPQNAVSFTMSGGTINISPTTASTRSNFGSFELFSTTSTFIMSGGTINLIQAAVAATPIDLQIRSVSTITGGVVNVGTGATVTNFLFRLRGNLPNFVVDNTTNNKTVNFTGTAQVNSLGTSTINSGATLNPIGLPWVIVGSSVINNGSIVVNTAGGRFYLLGTGPQTYSGTGTTTIISAGAVDLTMDNPAGLTIDPGAGPFITQRVNFFRGGITNANKITIGNGGTSVGVMQYGLAASINTAGNFDVAPVFNIGSGGQTLLYAQEGTGRTTGPEIPATRTVTAMTENNTNGLTIAGGDLTVTGAMTLTNGVIQTGTNILFHNGAATRTGGFVDGNLGRSYTATGSYTYHVGQGAYTPLTANITTLTTNPSILTARSFNNTLAGFSPTQSLSRNWSLEETGDLTATLTFVYDIDANDVNGTESDYRIWKREANGTATDMCGAPCVTPGTNTLGPLAGVTAFSRWTGAEAITPTAADANISGRVMTSSGMPIANVKVVLNGGDLPGPVIVYTGQLGYYNFENLPVGQNYVITVKSRRFNFSNPSHLINLQDSIFSEDFIADPDSFRPGR
ncbi:MAG TPA: hypothetical protein VGO50_08715 [Pyrinomonadaceae bacterium]|jgi:hypothetical protein|nr:hypothetical protein [Pyrinomonadaceae bacterium]